MTTFSHSPCSPKEAMIHTFQTIWQHASQAERTYIKKMWSTIMQPAHVLSWEPSQKTNEYQLELKQDLKGTHPEIPMAELILKRKMKIAFLEEKVSGDNHYQQMICFPDQGVVFRLGIGWLSKDSAVGRILIEENKQHKIVCSVEAFGQSIARLGDEALAFWEKANWYT